MVLQSLVRIAGVPGLFLRVGGRGDALSRWSTRVITPHDEFELIAQERAGRGRSRSGLSLLGFALPVASAVAHAADIVDCAIWSVIALVRAGHRLLRRAHPGARPVEAHRGRRAGRRHLARPRLADRGPAQRGVDDAGEAAMKRSSQVALLLMGVAGVGAGAYAMTPPRRNACVPPARRRRRRSRPGANPRRARPARRTVSRRARAWSSSSGSATAATRSCLRPAAAARPRTGRRRSSARTAMAANTVPAILGRADTAPSRLDRPARPRGSVDASAARRLSLAQRVRLDRPGDRRHRAEPMQRVACDERADWRVTAGEDRLRLSHHRRRALLGRARLLRVHARADRARPRSADRRARRPCAASSSARAVADERMHGSPAHSRGRTGTGSRRASSAATRASTAASTCATTARARRSSWSTTPTRRPRCSRPACFNGNGSRTRSRGGIVPKDADQYNSLHERLIEGWKAIGQGRRTAASRRHDSTAPRISARSPICEDCARQAGLKPPSSPMEPDRTQARGGFVDADERADRADVQALPLGMDDARGVRRLRCPARRRNSSSRRGRRSCRTRASCRCCGRCSRAIRTCCRPISTTTRRPPSSASSYVRKPLYSREGANVELVVDGRARRQATAAPMAPRASSARRSRRCRSSTATTRCSAPGSPPASLAACRCARTRARSPRTPRAFCRTPSSDRWLAQDGACGADSGIVQSALVDPSESRHPARPENRRPGRVRADDVHPRGRSGHPDDRGRPRAST